jgi:hypothetical protein
LGGFKNQKPKNMKKQIILLGLIMAFTLLGCVPSDDNPEHELIEGVAILETNNQRIPFVFNHDLGGKAAMVDDDENGLFDKLAYEDEDGVKITLDIDENTGLPKRMYHSDGLVIAYHYKDGNSLLDVALISENSTIEYVRNIETGINGLTNKAQQLPNLKINNTLDALKGTIGAMSLAWSAGTCIFSASSTFASAGVTLPVTLLTCAGFLTDFVLFVESASGVDNQLSNQLNGVRSLLGLISDFNGCATQGQIQDCISIGISAIGGILNIAEAILLLVGEDSAELAEGALISGFGQVKVTLTWNTGADIDLWVTEPNGNRIFWSSPTSSTGGILDFDDLDGPGPENIFWTENAPSGTYLVQVQNFSSNGATSTNYTVQTEINGIVEVFRGSLSVDNQVNDVTQFSLDNSNKLSSIVLNKSQKIDLKISK